MIDRIILELNILLKKSAEQNGINAIRFNPFLGYYRKDKNLFAWAATAFVLKNCKVKENQAKNLEDIISKITDNYIEFKNKDALPTYNFYPTRPSSHFPNGYLMHKLDHFRLPDDADDTALVFLTKKGLNPQKILELLKIHEDKAPKVKFKKHKVCKPIYNTWFGKNMPKEQDVCVLLNILFLVKINQSNLNQTDTNSIAYLVDNIKNIASYPFWLSRHYGNVPLILYHYARFMESFSDTDLQSGKQELIRLAKNQLAKESVFLNVILLEIALLKWGEKREMMEVDLEGDWQKDFYSCIGAPFAVYNFDIAQSKYLHIYWKIPIHEWAILLEYYSHFL